MRYSLSVVGVSIILFSMPGALLGTTTAARANPYTIAQQMLLRQIELFRHGAKPSYSFRQHGRVRRLITYATPIQHVVVIDMENRTVDNLFSAYFGTEFGHGPATWEAVMNLYNPNNLTQRLTQASLGAKFDPHHSHNIFDIEAQNGLAGWKAESFSCHRIDCPTYFGAFSYVPAMETSPYAQLVQNYASADEVFQANQGPSMPSHQYLIAGQSGGYGGTYRPVAEASNPTPAPNPPPEPTVNDLELGPPDDAPINYCGQTALQSPYVNMTFHWPLDTQPSQLIVPCETYLGGTILDEIAVTQGLPTDWDWQYIAHQDGGYWAAPTAVYQLWYTWNRDRGGVNEPFAVDANASNFVQNLITGIGTPPRPFAALTYITPCPNASDHADTTGNNVNGPDWVGSVVNAIGTAQGGQYWQNTAIIVTWDDWGGWFDHVGKMESANNVYRDFNGISPNPSDPNEWGFRVPVLVISRYVTFAGYVSHTPRSQSAILNLIETLFTLPSLGVDDKANGSDNMMDMFNFNSAIPFTPVNVGNYTIPSSCQ